MHGSIHRLEVPMNNIVMICRPCMSVLSDEAQLTARDTVRYIPAKTRRRASWVYVTVRPFSR